MDNTNEQTPVQQVNDSVQQAAQAQPAQENGPLQGPGGAPQLPPPTAPNVTPQDDSQKADLSKPPAQAQGATDPSQHPMVQKASVLRQVAEALAGGPKYATTIDPQTGVAKRTALPMSGRDIGMAIALEALSGGMAGAAAKGPNATGQAMAAGLNQGQQIAEQRKDQQQTADNMAQQDFARQMQTFHNNLQMMQVAKQIGASDLETNQKVAGQYGDLYNEVQKHYGQYILGTGGEDDAAKYHATAATAIPTGKVIAVYDPQTGRQKTGPAGNPLWQLEYAFIDPSFKGDNLLSAEDKQVLAKYGTKGFVGTDGKPSKLPDNFQLSANMALALKHRAVNLELADSTLQDYYKATKMDPKSLAAHVSDDPTVADALGKFVPYLTATDKDGRRLNYTEAVGHLGAKDPQAAGQILNLLGGTETVSKFDADNANKAEQTKKESDRQAMYDGPMTEATAMAALNDPKAPPEVKAKAQGVIKTASSIQNSRAYGEAASRTQGEIDTKTRNGIPLTGKSGNTVTDMIKDPNVQSIQYDDSEKNLKDGVNESYLSRIQAANPNLAALVSQIGHGQQMLSAYGLAKNDGQVLASMVARAFPDYHFEKTEGFKKTYDAFTSGDDSKQIEAANTTYRHVAAAYDSSAHPLLIPGTRVWADYVTQADKALDEVHGAYSKGVQHEEQFARSAEAVKSLSPIARREGWREIAKLLSDKSSEKQQTYSRAKPTKRLPDFDIISPDAQDAFKHITGNQIGTNGYVSGSRNGTPNNVQPEAPSGAAGIAKFGGVPYYVDASGKALAKAQ